MCEYGLEFFDHEMFGKSIVVLVIAVIFIVQLIQLAGLPDCYSEADGRKYITNDIH